MLDAGSMVLSVGAISMVARVGLVTIDEFGERQIQRRARKEKLIKRRDVFDTLALLSRPA
jgi:hypothetical protein